MPYDIEDGGGELAITPPYVQHPLSTRGKEPDTKVPSDSNSNIGTIERWAIEKKEELISLRKITINFGGSLLDDLPPDSQVQINNIVDEVRGDIPSDIVDRFIVDAIADELNLTKTSIKVGSWPFRTNAYQNFYDKVKNLLEMNDRL